MSTATYLALLAADDAVMEAIRRRVIPFRPVNDPDIERWLVCPVTAAPRSSSTEDTWPGG